MRPEESPPDPGIVALVQRLEDGIAERMGGHGRIALAYSGGLASTLIAMVARKRCDLECVVAGVADSADVRDARTVGQHLDFRITTVVLQASEALRLLRQAKIESPRVPDRAILPLLPLLAVHERAPQAAWLTGFGHRPLDPLVLARLRRLGVHSPWTEALEGAQRSREMLRAASRVLGLPEAWSRVRHRDPERGAGIASLLEAADDRDRT